jgi:cytochrome c553
MEGRTHMMKVIVRNLTVTRLVSAVIFMLFVAAPSIGRAQGMLIEIPFQFLVGSQTVPAGTYTFSVDSFGLVLQSGTSGQLHAMIITRLTGPPGFLQGGSAVFDKTGALPILSEVWVPGSDGFLLHSIPKNHSRDVLFFSALNQAGSASGKTAFNLTCAKCHGEGGNGNEAADKFFHTKIPRLTSPEVQNMSDAELKEIIGKGTQIMPPVEVEESGFRHRLPPQDVDAVVAYLRTLKR